MCSSDLLQDGLHPVTISHGYGSGFVAEFDWTGTRDMSACLAVVAALDFHERLGGPALRARNADLAAEAALLLAGRLGTHSSVGNAAAHSMAVVQLPIRKEINPEQALALRKRLLEMDTDAPISAIDGVAWLRVSAQAYNEIRDFDRLADMLTVLTA